MWSSLKHSAPPDVFAGEHKLCRAKSSALFHRISANVDMYSDWAVVSIRISRALHRV